MSMTKTAFDKPWGNYLLEGFVETPVPESISWLPQTLGWKILLSILVAFVALKIFRLYKNYVKNAYRREAIKWLSKHNANLIHDNLADIAVLIRKVALHAYPRVEISRLSGNDWDKWLDKECSLTSFSQNCPSYLHNISYQNNLSLSEQQITQLIGQVTLWVKHHRGNDE